MPRDILSRSGSRPQQQSQPALLPDKKGGQRILEGGAALGKLDFHAHAAHAKAVGIDGPFHEPGQPLLPGEGAVKGHTAHVSQRIRAHPGPPAIQLWRRKNFLSYTETFFHHFQVGNLKKIKKFFSCAPARA